LTRYIEYYKIFKRRFSMVGYEFKKYAEKNKLTNELMNNIIENISEEEWKKDFNGYYKSI
jgi:hypothetical protein